ncbi:MAG: hypothetical protein A2428_00345 [Bdellovibrionales bacterium RIFOXYC1_FULL_54_43]|nr:MAG: hypothetical protein A2428_00345 [Bdellovibrionales bacterium RIFOXYC1_FULL_54_43]OFZ81905.1 MAG: hypothetical protein A2603_03035 [Bdellovibrionales bacterium RIFOXYD1_FULL_55_31]
MIEIQERDRRILQSCYEHQVLTPRIVSRYFFRGKHRSESYRRIEELERAGYITRSANVFGGGQLTRLTKQGEALVRSHGSLDAPYDRRKRLFGISRSLLDTTVRLRLDELWDLVWLEQRSYP